MTVSLKENGAGTRMANVIDCPMGGGKTSAMIDYMNAMPEDERVIYCAPYISEGERIAKCCQKKGIVNVTKAKFDKRKTTDLKNRISRGESVACTHSLLKLLDDEILKDIHDQNYTVVIDEACEVLTPLGKKEKRNIDFLIRENFVKVHPETKSISFVDQTKSESCSDAVGKNLVCLINHGDVLLTGKGKASVWTFPVEVLNAFRRIVVMTYMFDAQIMRYYLLCNGYQFNYLGVRMAQPGKFELCLPEQADGFRCNLAEKIHIYDEEKLNRVGNGRSSLSAGWFDRNKLNKNGVSQLGLNYANLQKNIWKCSSRDFMWTCFGGGENEKSDNISKLIAGANKNIAKDYVAVNARAENKYSDRHYLGYGVNWHMSPQLRYRLGSKGHSISEDKWALSQMLQWIWRSAIRNGEEIWIYIPSRRMRTLLEDWIAKVSREGGCVA